MQQPSLRRSLALSANSRPGRRCSRLGAPALLVAALCGSFYISGALAAVGPPRQPACPPPFVAATATSLVAAAVPAAAEAAVTVAGEELDVNSFALGVLTGAVGAVVTLAAIFKRFLGNLSSGNLDGSRMGSSAGLVMPSFFFEGAAEIFTEVRQDSETALQRFRETGNFSEIYDGISLSEQGALLNALEALREKFPKTGTREVVFSAARWAALSSNRLASSVYDFARTLQRAGNSTLEKTDILSEIWSLDESRCSVSGRKPGEGGRRPWADPSADILLDQQAAALRRTTAVLLQRPLFAKLAPEILARPTYLALVRLFDVFAAAPLQAEGSGAYTEAEDEAIDQFLDQIIRTAVMRRAYRHLVETVGADFRSGWKEALREVWFQRTESDSDREPSVFEHVFLGNLTEDAAGQPIAGGLHCWLKFYLEEVRGRAKYLGYIYNDPEVGVSDNRFVSGKFVWDHAGHRLVKDQGGFFIGVSPEWQLACGTVGYFETTTSEQARRHGWHPLPAARTVGYTKDAAHDGYRYRHVVCLSRSEPAKEGGSRAPRLRTTYAAFLGRAVPQDPEASELDHLRGPGELAELLPTWLVAEGFTLRESSELARECVDFCIERGCRSLGEALRELRQVFEFILEDAVEAATTPGYPSARSLVADAEECVEPFLEVARAGPLSAGLPSLLEKLRGLGRRGPRLHRPLRLLLTGRADGAPVAEIIRLLELAEHDGGDAVGMRLHDRLDTIGVLLANKEPVAAPAILS